MIECDIGQMTETSLIQNIKVPNFNKLLKYFLRFINTKNIVYTRPKFGNVGPVYMIVMGPQKTVYFLHMDTLLLAEILLICLMY